MYVKASNWLNTAVTKNCYNEQFNWWLMQTVVHQSSLSSQCLQGEKRSTTRGSGAGLHEGRESKHLSIPFVYDL